MKLKRAIPVFALLHLLSLSAYALTLSSPAFVSNGVIPNQFTFSLGGQCRGNNLSPPLVIGDVPLGTQSLALTLLDLDGGNFLHWKAWDIPAMTVALPHNASARGGFRQATNDFGTDGYGGPCPPTPNHRYVFTLYALNTTFAGEPTIARLQAAALQTATLTGLRSPTDNVNWAQATGGLSDSDRLFNWAESRFAQLFAPQAGFTLSLLGYYYRYYNQTNSYVGTKDARVYYLAPTGVLLDLGAISDFLPFAIADGF